jgi:hypothetical protein
MEAVKLICPICEKQYITRKDTQIYCDVYCRDKMQRIKDLKKEAENKKLRLKSPMSEYDLKKDQFYLPKKVREVILNKS